MSYDDAPLLVDVNLEVPPGEVVALLGPERAGKSSLLRVVAGLQDVDRGYVRWDGADVARVPAHRRGFGLVFQDALLFPHLDVGGNVAYGLAASGVPKGPSGRRVEELLALVDLPGYAARPVSTLSGGEAQRVGPGPGPGARPAAAAPRRALRRPRPRAA